MKNTALVFITLVVGSLASPTIPAIFARDTVEELSRNERIVTGQIMAMIDAMAQQIRDAGLDPMRRSLDVAYKLPVPAILSANASVENFVFSGLSHIVVQSMNFSILRNRLTFNIVLPEVAVSVDNANGEVNLFGKEYTGAISGGFNVTTIRLVGDVRVNVGIISGISVRSLTLQFSVGRILPDLKINLFGLDLSSSVNTFLGTTVPNTLTSFAREINELLEIVALRVINDALNNRFLQ